jgi:hypothetical protein
MTALSELCGKVIKGYQHCSYRSEYCGRCPYQGSVGDGSTCYISLTTDAQELRRRVSETEQSILGAANNE